MGQNSFGSGPVLPTGPSQSPVLFEPAHLCATRHLLTASSNRTHGPGSSRLQHEGPKLLLATPEARVSDWTRLGRV